ncbi:MAG: 6-phosphogluconolactonase [Saccharospirillum sp.]
MALEQRVFETRDALTDKLVTEISARLSKAIAQTGRAALAVSGGRTPIGLFSGLSQVDLDWSNVVITLVDERWVSPDADDSNERLVREHLLTGYAAKAQFIPHKTKAETPFAAETELDQALAALPESITVTVLGMGEDGHTASFFPEADELATAIDPDNPQDCCGIVPKTAPHARMTLTLQRLLRSDWIVLHLTGDGKQTTLKAALADGPQTEMPVRTVLRQNRVPVSVYWAS